MQTTASNNEVHLAMVALYSLEPNSQNLVALFLLFNTNLLCVELELHVCLDSPREKEPRACGYGI